MRRPRMKLFMKRSGLRRLLGCCVHHLPSLCLLHTVCFEARCEVCEVCGAGGSRLQAVERTMSTYLPRTFRKTREHAQGLHSVFWQDELAVMNTAEHNTAAASHASAAAPRAPDGVLRLHPSTQIHGMVSTQATRKTQTAQSPQHAHTRLGGSCLMASRKDMYDAAQWDHHSLPPHPALATTLLSEGRRLHCGLQSCFSPSSHCGLYILICSETQLLSMAELQEHSGCGSRGHNSLRP
jgi:hypothetical protein